MGHGVVQDPSIAPNPADASVGISFPSIRKTFGEVVALDGVTFEVERHSRIGIVGPSGGGKSTLLQLVAGLLEPDSGVVNVEGATDREGAAVALRDDAATRPPAPVANRARQRDHRPAEPRRLP